MTAKWQKWMPFHIDRFMGSRYVQAMHPAARSGYLYLLAAQWQSDDCMLLFDDEELATLSGLGVLWSDFGRTILRQFVIIDDTKIRNSVLFEEWSEALRVFEARRKGANTVNERTASAERADSDRTAVRRAHTQTQTDTETETVKQVSEAKASSPRKSSGKADPAEAIYQAYPRKVGHRSAIKAITQAIQRLKAKDMTIREAEVYLYRRVQAYARSPAGNDGPGTPHPSRWFNDERYEDDQDQWQVKNSERGTNAQRPQSRTGLQPGDAEEVIELFRRIETGEAYAGDAKSLRR